MARAGGADSPCCHHVKKGEELPQHYQKLDSETSDLLASPSHYCMNIVLHISSSQTIVNLPDRFVEAVRIDLSGVISDWCDFRLV